MGNKIKKLVAIVTLGLMVGVGFGVAGQATKAIDSSSVVEVGEGQVTDDVPYDYEGKPIDDDILYGYYGDDVTYEENTRDIIEALVLSGHMTREEADLELAFMDAQTHEDKQKVYEEMIDYYVRIGDLTEEEGIKLKKAGYDAPWDAVQLDDYFDYLDEMVREGVMTQREADLEKAFLKAETDDERQKAYEGIINYYVEIGELTEQEAKEIKEMGYVI